MVPAQTEFILLYHVVRTLPNAQIAWRLVRTSDSHPHLPGPLDSRSKYDLVRFTGDSDDLMMSQVWETQAR